MTNYFKKYSNREEAILNYWIETTSWVKDKFIRCIEDHTPFHDWKVFVNIDGKELSLTVQIKEEENFWFNKTGNLGLDFISAFEFLKDEFRREVENSSFWIDKNKIEEFLSKKIKVLKWGKLVTCDSAIHIFFVEKKICQAYDNSKLKAIKTYLKSNYPLRINKKKDYGLSDVWESAAFFVKPDDKELKNCEINDIGELKKSMRI